MRLKPKGKFLHDPNLKLLYLFYHFFGIASSLPLTAGHCFNSNIPDTRFIILQSLLPQDFFIFGLTMVTFIFLSYCLLPHSAGYFAGGSALKQILWKHVP